jgi:hypothetical protein
LCGLAVRAGVNTSFLPVDSATRSSRTGKWAAFDE